jgi:hypothetical protein
MFSGWTRSFSPTNRNQIGEQIRLARKITITADVLPLATGND